MEENYIGPKKHLMVAKYVIGVFVIMIANTLEMNAMFNVLNSFLDIDIARILTCIFSLPCCIVTGVLVLMALDFVINKLSHQWEKYRF